MIGLYVITTENKDLGRGHVDVARAALRAGCRWIQYREKDRDTAFSSGQAEMMLELAKEYGARLVINDWVELAVRLGADGLHIGQSDDLLEEARGRFSGLIGVSASTIGEARQAAGLGADYIGFGPIFPTASKPDAALPTGLETLTEVRRITDTPIVAIGGISAENVKDIIGAGANGAAVIAAVASEADMEGAAARLVGLIGEGRRDS